MAENTTVKESENRAIIEYFTHNRDVDLLQSPSGLELVSVPAGRTVHSLKKFKDELLTAPERCKGISEHTTLPSFIGHVSRFKDDGTVLFVDVANKRAPSLLAVYDYNAGPGKPRFGQHRSSYKFPLSDEWVAWGNAFASAALTQTAFAELIEERMLDLLAPPSNVTPGVVDPFNELGITLAMPQAMLSLSRGLAVQVDQNVKQAVKLASGEGQIVFEEKHDATAADGAPVRVPGGFLLAIPVFENGELFKVSVRLRYRVANGRVVWALVPHRLNKVFELATREAAEQARAATDLPLFFGKPEGNAE